MDPYLVLIPTIFALPFNIAAIPLLLLIYTGLKRNLALTEKFAWLHFSLFGIMTIMSYASVGNLHFSEQSWATRIGWIEVFACAWIIQLIYEKAGSKKGGYVFATRVRTFVYLLIPVLSLFGSKLSTLIVLRLLLLRILRG